MRVLINEDLPEVSIVLDHMFDVVKEHSISSSNKFMFDRNDYKKGKKSPFKLLNDQMWKQGDGIVLNSNEFAFYILKEEKTITVYANDNIAYPNGIEALIKNISNNPEEAKKNLAFKAQYDKVAFINDAFIHAFSNNVNFAKLALIDAGYGEPKYPVDIKSYEYQLSYWQKKTRIPEFDFVNNVLLGGFMSDYDSEKGRFYIKNTKYDPSVIGFRIKERDQKTKVSIVDPNKVDFEYLDKDWHSALHKVLDVLKKDRPQYGEKEDGVDKLIKFYEKKLGSKSAQSSLKF
jgi:hypothetical protein